MKIIFIALLVVWCCIGFQKRTSGFISPMHSNLSNFIDTTKSSYNTLTDLDRNKYILTVKLIGVGKDACSTPTRKSYMLKAVLQNKSSDTLKYIDWTCLHQVWHSDNKQIWANEQDASCTTCDANFITILRVPPHQSVTKQLIAEFKTGAKSISTKFRVGIILQRIIKKKDWEYYGKYFILKERYHLNDQLQNLIWSNSIQLMN
jgi:hypothetical protein